MTTFQANRNMPSAPCFSLNSFEFKPQAYTNHPKRQTAVSIRMTRRSTMPSGPERGLYLNFFKPKSKAQSVYRLALKPCKH